MPATDHSNDGPNNEPNSDASGRPNDENLNNENPSHDRRKENDLEGNDGRDERRSLTRRERFENLRFNRTLGSVLDTLERAGFAFFIAAWTLLAVYDQLDAPLTSETVLAVSGPVVMVIAVVLRVWLLGRFERPEE